MFLNFFKHKSMYVHCTLYITGAGEKIFPTVGPAQAQQHTNVEKFVSKMRAKKKIVCPPRVNSMLQNVILVDRQG